MFDYQIGDLLLTPFLFSVGGEKLFLEPPDGCSGSVAAPCPKNNQSDGQSDGKQPESGYANPIRQLGEVDQYPGHLHDQPGCHRMQHRHAMDIATLHFQEQIHLFFLFKLQVSRPHLHRFRVTVAIRSARGY